MKRLFNTTSSLLLVLLAASPAFPGDEKRPDLQGTWKLNEDLTARMRETDREGSPGRMRGGAPGDLRRPGGGRGIPGDGPRSGRRRPEGAAPSLAALDELTIVQTATDVTITDREGRQRVLPTNGKKVRLEDAPGGPLELRAAWDKNGSLVVKVDPDDGPRRTETYLVSNDRKLLYLTVTMDPGGPLPEIRIRRAYDAVPGREERDQT